MTKIGRALAVPASYVDLRQPAFARLADPGLGNIWLTWKFVRS